MDRSDPEISSDIVEALSRDSRVNTARITVIVNAGCVTLSGDTPTLYTASIARELVACVPGIRAVCCELEVVRPAGIPADTDICSHAEHILSWNASIGAREVSVSVNCGRVKLEGEVDAYWQRSRAEALILDIQGVVGVINKLVVIPELVPGDQVIASDVKSAITRCTCLNHDDITVEVEQGLVTLSGQVPSWWSKQNTPQLAESILGVKGVVDRLVVEQS